jgi:hypothetical protein
LISKRGVLWGILSIEQIKPIADLNLVEESDVRYS